MDTTNELPNVDAAGIEKLKAFNAGSNFAFSKVALTLMQLDPTGAETQTKVLIKYLDAWIAEVQLKNENVRAYAKDLQQESFKEFLQQFGATPEECNIDFAPELQEEIKRRCRKVVIETFNEFASADFDEDYDEDDEELPESFEDC